MVLIGLYFLKCTRFDQLILKKIIKIVATRCQILTLKCTKIDFGCEGREREGEEREGGKGERREKGGMEEKGKEGGKGPSPPEKKILAPPLLFSHADCQDDSCQKL